MRELGKRLLSSDESATKGVVPQKGVSPTLDDFLTEWNGPELMMARQACREIPFDPYDEDWEKIRPSFVRIFHFLESLSEAVLSGRLDELQARAQFEKSVRSIWPIAHTHLAPVNDADEWWDPPPKIALLSARWQKP
jgi:hypothetical protein